MHSYIHLPAQGCGGFRNTTEVEIHPEWDTHTFTHILTHSGAILHHQATDWHGLDRCRCLANEKTKDFLRKWNDATLNQWWGNRKSYDAYTYNLFRQELKKKKWITKACWLLMMKSKSYQTLLYYFRCFSCNHYSNTVYIIIIWHVSTVHFFMSNYSI